MTAPEFIFEEMEMRIQNWKAVTEKKSFISQWHRQKNTKTPPNPFPLHDLLGKKTEIISLDLSQTSNIICCYSLMFFHVFQLKQVNWIGLSFLCPFHLLRKSEVTMILYLL